MASMRMERSAIWLNLGLYMVGSMITECGEGFVVSHPFREEREMDRARCGSGSIRAFLLNALESEARFPQGVADGGDVGCAAGFDGDVDDGFAEADAVVG